MPERMLCAWERFPPFTPKQMTSIYEANIDINDVANKAVESITDRFAAFGYATDASTDERIWDALWDNLKTVELTKLN